MSIIDQTIGAAQPGSRCRRGSDYAELLSRVRQAGLLERCPTYYLVMSAVNAALVTAANARPTPTTATSSPRPCTCAPIYRLSPWQTEGAPVLAGPFVTTTTPPPPRKDHGQVETGGVSPGG
ncbi:hypothetical protein AB0C22_03670 [Micromonospora sp. NPDC048894]|uniref:hypothetical protein n=1 Tax=unclassified Micromonospora TaxID=2617518 RepID=UPI00340F92BA